MDVTTCSQYQSTKPWGFFCAVVYGMRYVPSTPGSWGCERVRSTPINAFVQAANDPINSYFQNVTDAEKSCNGYWATSLNLLPMPRRKTKRNHVLLAVVILRVGPESASRAPGRIWRGLPTRSLYCASAAFHDGHRHPTENCRTAARFPGRPWPSLR